MIWFVSQFVTLNESFMEGVQVEKVLIIQYQEHMKGSLIRGRI
jgi:hypothetical protein